jgi:hypothetical protein
MTIATAPAPAAVATPRRGLSLWQVVALAVVATLAYFATVVGVAVYAGTVHPTTPAPAPARIQETEPDFTR